MRLTILQIFWVLVCLVSPTAWSHGIDLFAWVEGDKIIGTLAYADGTPIQNQPVQAFAPDGTVIAMSETDESGGFSMQVQYRVRHRLVGDGGEGHRGLFTIPMSEFPIQLPAFEKKAQEGGPISQVQTDAIEKSSHLLDTAAMESAIARQLGPLREQLHEYEQRVRIRDVFGGIGYVFGLFGLFVLLKQRQRVEKKR